MIWFFHSFCFYFFFFYFRILIFFFFFVFLIVNFVRRVCLTVTIFNNILSFYLFFCFGRDCLRPNIWRFNKLFSCTTFRYSFLASSKSLIYSLSFLGFFYHYQVQNCSSLFLNLLITLLFLGLLFLP